MLGRSGDVRCSGRTESGVPGPAGPVLTHLGSRTSPNTSVLSVLFCAHPFGCGWGKAMKQPQPKESSTCLIIARFTVATSGSTFASGGALSISGLPFKSSAIDSNDNGTCTFTRWSGVALDTSVDYFVLGGLIAPGTDSIILYENSGSDVHPAVQLLVGSLYFPSVSLTGVAMYHI
jgi:hypothetical protein